MSSLFLRLLGSIVFAALLALRAKSWTEGIAVALRVSHRETIEA